MHYRGWQGLPSSTDLLARGHAGVGFDGVRTDEKDWTTFLRGTVGTGMSSARAHKCIRKLQ